MKKILILTIINILTFNAFKVEAATYDGYVYEGKTIEGIYYKTNENALIEAKTFVKSDSTDTIYSIEYKNNLSGAKEGDYEDTSDYRKTNLTQRQTKRMNLIGYYGYNYQDDTYDHTDIKWYAITQYLIWREEDKNNLIGIVDANGDNIFEEEINEIEKIIKHHYIRPNFGANKFRVKSYDEITIEDKNHVMSEYELIEPNNLAYQVQDDKIMAISDIAASYTFKFHKKDTRYTNSCVFYVSKEYRNAMQIGKYDDISANVIINFISGKVLISKIGEQLIDFVDNDFIYDERQVTGSTYYLYAKEDTYNNVGKLLFHKNDKVSELTIGEENSIDNLYLTDYYVKEIENAYSYVLDRNNYDVHLDMDNKNESLEFIGKYQDLLVKFTTVRQEIKYKNGKPSYSYKAAEGITFGLYNGEDIYSDIDSSTPLVKKDTLLYTSVSDKNGQVIFDLNIPLGKYYVARITENEMYYDDVDRINFPFTHSTNPKPTYTLMSFYNLLKTQKITFTNKDDKKSIMIYDKNKDAMLNKDVYDELTQNLPLGEYYYQIDDGELYSFILDGKTEVIINLNKNLNNDVCDNDNEESNQENNINSDLLEEIEDTDNVYEENNQENNDNSDLSEESNDLNTDNTNTDNTQNDDSIDNDNIDQDNDNIDKSDDENHPFENDANKEDIIIDDDKKDESNIIVDIPIIDDKREETSVDNVTNDTIEKVEFIEENKNVSTSETLSQNTNKYQEINVDVPATDKFDLAVYTIVIVLFVLIFAFINVKS